MRIAVADDEPDMTDFYREALARLGHEVFAAQDGWQLVQLCREVKPDLVVTDLQMPQLNGIEAVRQVSQEQPVAAILVTAAEVPGCVLPPCFCGFLRKPIHLPDLQAALTLANNSRHANFFSRETYVYPPPSGTAFASRAGHRARY